MEWNKYWSLEHPTRQPSTINHQIFWDCRLSDAETQIGKGSGEARQKTLKKDGHLQAEWKTN